MRIGNVIGLRALLLIYFCSGLSFLMPLPLGAQTDFEMLELKAQMDGLVLRPLLQYYRDTSGKMELKDIAALPASSFKKAAKDNYGYSNDIFWLKLVVQNTSEQELKWFALLNYTPTDSLTLFQEAKNTEGEWIGSQTGDRHNFSNRGLRYRKPNLLVYSPGNSTQTLYFRIKSRGVMYLNLEAWDRESLVNAVSRETLILGGFYGAMLVIMIYNLFLYFFVRDFYYVVYVYYICLYVLFQLVLDGMAFQLLWPESTFWASVALPFFISTAMMGLIYFSVLFLNLKKNQPILYKIQMGLIGVLGLSALLSLVLGIELVNWSVRISVITAMISFIVCLTAGVLCYRQRVQSARYYLLAWALLITFGFIRSAEAMVGLPPIPFVSNYAIHIGSLLLIFMFSVALGNRINTMRLNLQVKVKALNNANHKIEYSEKKYRQLVESSDDIIFSLDGDLNFLSVNKAVKKHLAYNEADLLGKNLLELVYEDPDENRRMTEALFLKEKIQTFSQTRGRISFNANFKHRHSHEARDMAITLEHIDSGAVSEGKTKNPAGGGESARVEILGKATSIAEDVYSQYLNHEKHSYSMESYLRNAEILSQRLTRNLSKHMDAAGVTTIRIAIREMLINAIEHGNLSISFDDKTEAMMQDGYLDMVLKRQNDSRFRNRLVHVDYILNSERVVFQISDEGEGFDHEGRAAKSLEKANEEALHHGRGLAMAKSEFDEVYFNDKGNRILLVKYFEERPGPHPDETGNQEKPGDSETEASAKNADAG